jgi:hypothetical protein
VKKFVATTMIAGAFMIGSAGAASAHFAPPCNDTDGDGQASGQEYAQHHISAGAHEGIIGHDHKPGTHRGFSACNPSGR